MCKMKNYYKADYDKNIAGMLFFVLVELNVFFYWYCLPSIIGWFNVSNDSIVWEIYEKFYDYGILYMV